MVDSIAFVLFRVMSCSFRCCRRQMDKDGSGTISMEEFDNVLSSQANLSKGIMYLGHVPGIRCTPDFFFDKDETNKGRPARG